MPLIPLHERVLHSLLVGMVFHALLSGQHLLLHERPNGLSREYVVKYADKQKIQFLMEKSSMW
jgi:hypothetical protein